MLIVKKARLPPKTEYSTATVEFAYLEGVQGKLPSLGVRVNFFRKGDYYILYKVDYQEGQNQCKKLNILMQGQEDVIESTIVRRLKPESFRKNFYKEMHERHYQRLR